MHRMPKLNPEPFVNTICVITGGAMGLGRALCLELGQRGATVVVADTNHDGAAVVARHIADQNGTAHATQTDVTDSAQVERLLEDTVSRYGRLDYVFNNAGIAVAGELQDIRLDHWRKIVDVNLLGVAYGTTLAYRIMIRQGSGHIVNIASLAGLTGFPPAPAYAATKAAVIGLCTSLRPEAARHGVRVSAVCPGLIDTGIFASALGNTTRILQFKAAIAARMVSTDKAAKQVLAGVRRNQGVIVFPGDARVLWILCRIHPVLFSLLAKRLYFRKSNTEKGM